MASTTATPKSNRDGLAALDEALQAGAATLQRLEEQGEQLHQTEIVADSNKYLLDRSAREIRGMTWSGWLQNQFTSGPAVPKPPPAPLRPEVAPQSRHQPPIPSGGTSEQDQYVADLSQQLDDVLACGKQLKLAHCALVVCRLLGAVEEVARRFRAEGVVGVSKRVRLGELRCAQPAKGRSRHGGPYDGARGGHCGRKWWRRRRERVHAHS